MLAGDQPARFLPDTKLKVCHCNVYVRIMDAVMMALLLEAGAHNPVGLRFDGAAARRLDGVGSFDCDFDNLFQVCAFDGADKDVDYLIRRDLHSVVFAELFFKFDDLLGVVVVEFYAHVGVGFVLFGF